MNSPLVARRASFLTALVLTLFLSWHAGATTHVVTFVCCEYTPTYFQAALGDTVEWQGDFSSHPLESTTIPAGASPFSNGSGTSFSYVIQVAGTYSYQCQVHQPSMAGSFGAGIVNYGYTQYIDAGNPGGLNTDGDATTTGWINIVLGSQSTNIWSTAQPIPFVFEYFGTPVTQFKASQNGLVTFDTATTLLPNDNMNLPTDSLPNMTVACYWDQFTPTPPTGTNDYVQTKVFGTAPNQQLWIKWFSFEYGGVSFSYIAVVLEETTNKIYLVDLYNSTTPLLSTTAGLQFDPTTAFRFGDSTIAQGGNGSGNADNDYIEFYVLADIDAGIARVDSPAAPMCGSSDLWVTIENSGLQTLDSAEVHWSVNSVPQSVFQWVGPLSPGMSTSPVHIGPFAFAHGDTLRVWTENPNGVPDGNPLNDTASTIVRSGLASGTYTVGGGTPDYATFSAAALDLAEHGICGPVVFNVAPGMYNEQLELLAIEGTSSTNTITFNCSGATIDFAPTVTDARHIVRLNGAAHVRFNGLVIQVDTGATYGWGIQLSNSADSNSFVNCTVIGDTTSTSSNFVGIVSTGSNSSPTTAGDNASYLTLDSCTVIGSYYGIRLNGSTTGTSGIGNTVRNSTIKDTYIYNMYMYYQTDAVISGNEITRPDRTIVSTFYGIYFATSARNCTVEKNRIHNTHGSASVLTGASYGIYFSAADALVGQENVVKNNLLYDFNSNGTAYVLYNSGSSGVYYYNNTISLDDTAATAGATRGFYQTTAADNVDFRNNIVTITRGGTGIKHGLYFATTASTIVSNNNAIYLNSAGSGAQYFGDYGGTDYATYNDWRTANGGIYDSLSVNADPLYADVLNDNLVPTAQDVDDVGATLAEVTEDILGNPRGIPPDPGAYEFEFQEPLSSLNHNTGLFTMGIFNDGSIGTNNQSFAGPGITWRGEQGLFVGGPIFGTAARDSVNGHLGSFSIFADIQRGFSDFAGGFGSDANFTQITSAVLNDSGAPQPYGVQILQRTYSDTGQDYAFIRYGFVNSGVSALNNFSAGILLDWDIGNYATNSGGYDTARGLVYQLDAIAPPPYYYGMAALDGMSGGRATTSTPTPTIRQGSFTFMTTFDLAIGANGDFRSWLGARPMNIAAGDTGWATFAISAGDDLAQLRTHVDSAQAKALALGWVTIGPVGVNEVNTGVPKTFELSQNYPNPFNPTTTIQFALPTASNVTLTVYNVLGQNVATLIDGQQRNAAYHSVEWNGRNRYGSPVATGLYFYRIEAKPADGSNSFTQIRKMLLLK